MTDSISCPVSQERVEEGIVRRIAFLTAWISAFSIFKFLYIPFLFLALDFAIRAFSILKIKSPLRILSSQFLHYSFFEKKYVDAAPKRFAAGIGFLLSLLISLFIFVNYIKLAISFSIILIFCALLEGLFSICFGCLVYSKIVLPISKLIK